MTEFSIGGEFGRASRDDWRALVARVVGERGESALDTTTRDGLKIAALHGQHHPGSRVDGRAGGQPWRVVQRIEHPDPGSANRLIRAELEFGASGIELVFPGSAFANGHGIALETLDDMRTLLADVDLEAAHWRLEAGHEARFAAAMFAAVVEERGVDPSGLDVAFNFNPSAAPVFIPLPQASVETLGPRVGDAVSALRRRGFSGVMLLADGRYWHAAGGSDAQEIGFALANAVAHLRLLEQCGIAPEEGVAHIGFALTADADQFATMARIRACRMLWRRVVAACGVESRPVHVHAETAWRMMTRRDPWTNILRGAIAVTGAALGGADSVAVLPYTEALGVARPMARRIARNTQLVLMEEAGLADVADPAAGSGYVEACTQALAEAGWELFRRVEAGGGLLAAVAGGWARDAVREVADARLRDIATRRDPITGVSEFPQLAETPVAVLATEPPSPVGQGSRIALPPPGGGELFEAFVEAGRAGAGFADLAIRRGAGEPTLPRIRLAEPFETLRDAADRYTEERGRRPAVVLATLGDPAAHGARATWMRNVLAAGGLDAVEQPAADPAALGTGGSATSMVCLCGTDAAYAEAGEGLVAGLRAAGAARVEVVGRDGDHAGGLRAAGVDGFIHAGCDILSWLRSVHEALGIDQDADGRSR